MNENEKLELIKTSWEGYIQGEASFLDHPASRGDEGWLEKQRFLLADMALHLLQTSMKPGEINLERLRDNIHSVLTIIEQCWPNAGRMEAREKVYVD